MAKSTKSKFVPKYPLGTPVETMVNNESCRCKVVMIIPPDAYSKDSDNWKAKYILQDENGIRHTRTQSQISCKVAFRRI